MDDRKRPRAKDDDLPIVGDYSDARNARLRAEALLAEARAASGRFPAPRPPPAARPASSQPAPPSGSDAWRLDPRDVARHAQLRRQREQVGPLGRALRYSAVVLVLAGAFAVYWNFDTLRSVTIEFPALSALLPDSWSGDSGARAGGGEKSAEVESNTTSTYAMPVIEEPRTAVDPGMPSSARVSASVTWVATSVAG